MKLTYRLCGDYYLPNIGIPAEDMRPLGKYGRMRMRYLREHRSLLFNQLLLSGKLMKHLYSIDDACQERMDLLIPQMKAAEGVTEELKAVDQMEWVRRMNSIHKRIEEMLFNELIRSTDKRTATIQVTQPKLKRYNELTQQIKQKTKARKALVAEQKNTSKLNLIKQHDLSRQITTLTEEIEELRSEKENLLLDLGCADDAGVKAVQSEVTVMEASLHKLDEQKEQCSAELNETLQQYKQLQSQANADSDEIQRNAVTAASTRLQQAYGKRFDAQLLRDSQKEISRLADPHEADSSIREQLRFASLRAEKEASYKHHSRETTPPAR